jgi:hypothetical protein
MGFQRTIESAVPITWPAVKNTLLRLGEQPVLRMIDGLPAFPEEIPADDWKELRIGLSGEMVTLRRSARGYECVSWGSPTGVLKRSLDAVCVAVASFEGVILTDEGRFGAKEYAVHVGFGERLG